VGEGADPKPDEEAVTTTSRTAAAPTYSGASASLNTTRSLRTDPARVAARNLDKLKGSAVAASAKASDPSVA